MRNWNEKEKEDRNNDFYNCEPTYEELKHTKKKSTGVLIDSLRAYLWGIETMEALYLYKHYTQLRAYLWGIET